MKAIVGDAAGFTLVETLIGVALLGLLSVMLLGGVATGSRVMESSRRHADTAAHLSASYNFMRNMLAQAQPLPRPGSTGERPLVEFEGRIDGLTLVTRSPAYLATGGYQRLSLAVETGPAGRELVALWEPRDAIAGAPERDRQRKSVLFENVAQVNFLYFGFPPRAPRNDWFAAWRDQTTLPARIRISVMLRDGSSLPDLVVALPLSNNWL